MTTRNILLLGDENLYKISDHITIDTIDKATQVIDDLHDTIVKFKNEFGFGRAIAAPQIDEAYRIIYFHLGDEMIHFINPIMEPVGTETFEMWDDCMSFPGLEVYVSRYKSVRVYYKDLEWNDHEVIFEDDLSELFQHEFDHLNGILSVQQALSNKAFRMNTSNSY